MLRTSRINQPEEAASCAGTTANGRQEVDARPGFHYRCPIYEAIRGRAR